MASGSGGSPRRRECAASSPAAAAGRAALSGVGHRSPNVCSQMIVRPSSTALAKCCPSAVSGIRRPGGESRPESGPCSRVCGNGGDVRHHVFRVTAVLYFFSRKPSSFGGRFGSLAARSRQSGKTRPPRNLCSGGRSGIKSGERQRGPASRRTFAEAPSDKPARPSVPATTPGWAD